MNIIQSKSHRLGIYEISKIYLSCFDDKSYIVDNGIKAMIIKILKINFDKN